ncbi:hypothetical protein JOQ06_024076 [Pogonophryne albipinna]|uniref:Uncharacterized protein n=1 Tax=Pogonophryne albipinna TaxID=1090488 RepID=A0AAD6BNR7_9TELE|nr:hypothetical protein JOQ06_024076 [Pogonophryne albipinna]
MSEVTDSKQSADSASRKRREVPSKCPKVRETLEEAGATSESCKNSEADGEETARKEDQSNESEGKPAQGLQGSEDPCAPPMLFVFVCQMFAFLNMPIPVIFLVQYISRCNVQSG